MKIVADDKIPFLRGVLEPWAEMVYLPGGKISPADVRDADALLVRTRTRCDRALLEGSTVRFVGSATIGYDHIDTAWCDANGIHWTNAPGCNADSVEQYITAALLHLASKYGMNLNDYVLGIVGVGNVGSRVEKAARVLGMPILLNDPPRQDKGEDGFVSLEQIAYEADFITFHVPLNREGKYNTLHLADQAFFDKLCNGTFVINSSRGEVVDHIALKRMLREGKIAGAVLDVWEGEPNIDRELLSLVELGTPHIAGYSYDGKANGTSMIVNALSQKFGLPLTNWYPAKVPLPEKTHLTIDTVGLSDQEVLSRAVSFSYSIYSDHSRLLAFPEQFEKLRGDYPLRREYRSFSVEAANLRPSASQKLNGLGFQTVAT